MFEQRADKYLALHYLNSFDTKKWSANHVIISFNVAFSTALVCKFRSQQAMTERLHHTIMKAFQFAEVYRFDQFVVV